MVARDAAKALAIARKLKSMLNVEYKSHQAGLPATPDLSGAVQILTGIAQGDDQDDRDGNKIKSFSLQVKGTILQHASASTTFARLMVVQDRSGTTTQPGITDMFSTVAAFAEGRPSLQTPQVNSRFKVISDTILHLSSNGTQLKRINLYRKLRGHIYYSGPAATDEGRGNIYMFVASNEATNKPSLLANSVFKWIDN